MARKQKEKNVKSCINLFFHSEKKHSSDNFLIFLVVLYFSVEHFSNSNTKKKYFFKMYEWCLNEKGL